jgi:hypothetical protein
MLRFAKHLAGTLSVFLVGCSVGPNYKRPLTNLPQSFRGTPGSDIGGPASSASLADQQWSGIFQDPVLQRLVTEALQNNLDLHIAGASPGGHYTVAAIPFSECRRQLQGCEVESRPVQRLPPATHE